ncbi:YciI family protein [uncultured Sphingomonas sp.]|uniref:YciI family protein n=1 Tax=uncultured Sphingomonas sp. TaxID=158754 RepID=UPI0025EC09B7|nr:YciI family protein [uncultured Sphingomonas sp.]
MIRPATPLTLVLITYTDKDAIERLRPTHVEWIREAIDAGVMLLAGRRDDAEGGVLLFRGTPENVRPVAESDPFVTGGGATIELVGFPANLADDALAAVLT